ncbi:hypothetical protein CBP51_01655 [Cellvibrio mixtus]|uniref:Uncharacterized protein n=1 Tax=Cellvibrio mixtus TaxID=39650 RepID=A0A266Q7J0_9GAMM|nr:hypothetical protein CBP51_01655 [Cellvibrio mixtus]
MLFLIKVINKDKYSGYWLMFGMFSLFVLKINRCYFINPQFTPNLGRYILQILVQSNMLIAEPPKFRLINEQCMLVISIL